jgi:DnaJ-class molecular chaperone
MCCVHRHVGAQFLRECKLAVIDIDRTGGSIEVPTPGGPVRMRVPAGSDSGTELRLRGRGVPAHAGRAAGDLYATLRVQLGKPDPALDAFLKDWTPEHPTDPRQAMGTNS